MHQEIRDHRHHEIPLCHTSDEYDVIIVGAGVSGLSTARELKLADPELSVLILEADNRIGGRIWTVNPWGTKLELGASWIHGIENNPLIDIFIGMGHPTQPTIYNDLSITMKLKSTTLFDSHGNKISRERKENLSALSEQFLKFLTKEQSIAPPPEYSLMEVFQKFAKENNITGELLNELFQITRILHSNEYAADLQNLSIFEHECYYFEGEEASFGSNAILPYGYDFLTSFIASNLAVKVNTKVTEISYSQNGVLFQTNNGSYKAKYGVLTVPLGVLQAKAISFDPPLPTLQQEAIDHLQMGIFNKIYLFFPCVFWDTSEWIISIPPAGSHEIFDFMNLHRYCKHPILLGFVSGQFAIDLEKKNDNEIIELCMNKLRKMYGNKIPNPSSALITRWGQNPLFYGSYSYLPSTPYKTNPHAVMAPPLENRLFFGGEAFSMHQNSTVYGAYMRGQQIANEILENV